MIDTRMETILPHNQEATDGNRHDIIIVTGLSGAGKTSVMRALEDLGFYCVDNFPVPLMAVFLKLIFDQQTSLRKIALGIDARNQQFLADFFRALDELSAQDPLANVKIIFVNAQRSTLIKRFSETRRKHPLADNISLDAALSQEHLMLEPLRERASIIIDTDTFNIHQLRGWVEKILTSSSQRKLTVQLLSFGFKYGLPPESNLVFDLRFLPNPYFVPELKPLSGKDALIQDFLFSQQIVQDYWHKIYDFIGFSLKNFYHEGRFFVTIGIGCTGGRHRSVAFVERLKALEKPFVSFVVTHRDVDREGV